MIHTLALVILLSGSAHAGSWGPWSTNMDAPVILSAADREDTLARPETEYSIAATPFIWLLKLYRSFISPLDGDRCPMYPTCSQYSIQAIHKHGPFIGIIMTADRLIHEADEQRHAFAVKIGSKYRYMDTVESNDFWWYER